MATYTITLNERTTSGKALMTYLQSLGVLIQKVKPQTSTKARIFDPESGRYLKDSVVKSIREAHEDINSGKLKSYDSVEDMFQDLGIKA